MLTSKYCDQLIFKLNCKDYNASEKKPISYAWEAATGARNDVYTKDSANYETYKKAYNYYMHGIQRHVENPDQTGCAGSPVDMMVMARIS